MGGPFLLAVLLAAVVGGLVPALVATATSFVGMTYFYVEPVHSLRLTGSSLASVAVWVACAAVTTAVLDRRRRAFAILRSTGQVAAFALERGDVGAWELAGAAETLWLSPDAERLFGLPKGTFDGRLETMFSFVHPDDVAATRDALNRIAGGALEVTTDFRIVRPDGERRSLELRGGTVAGAESGTSALAGILSDVTERLAREDQLRFLSDVSTTLASSLDSARRSRSWPRSSSRGWRTGARSISSRTGRSAPLPSTTPIRARQNVRVNSSSGTRSLRTRRPGHRT